MDLFAILVLHFQQTTPHVLYAVYSAFSSTTRTTNKQLYSLRALFSKKNNASKKWIYWRNEKFARVWSPDSLGDHTAFTKKKKEGKKKKKKKEEGSEQKSNERARRSTVMLIATNITFNFLNKELIIKSTYFIHYFALYNSIQDYHFPQNESSL